MRIRATSIAFLLPVVKERTTTCAGQEIEMTKCLAQTHPCRHSRMEVAVHKLKLSYDRQEAEQYFRRNEMFHLN